MTKEQEMKARSSFTGVSLDELLSDKCLIRLTQQQYQDAIQLVLHLDNKIRVLTDDNQQLMAQISTGDVTFDYAEPLIRIATALEAIADSLKPILITKGVDKMKFADGQKITIVKYNGRKYQDTIAGDCTNGDIYTWDGMCFDRLTLLDKVIPNGNTYGSRILSPFPRCLISVIAIVIYFVMGKITPNLHRAETISKRGSNEV